MEQTDKVILIIEDDEGLRSQLKWHFDEFNTTVVTADNRAEAISAVRQHEPLVIIQDLGLPPDPEGVSEGLRCLSDILTLNGQTKVIVLTGKGDRRNALRSVELGAFDFYTKPIDTQALDHAVKRAFRVADLERENRRKMALYDPIHGLITNHLDMLKVCKLAEKIAPSTITCTLLGESGTGKEVIARMLHRISNHKDGPFVAINCAAIPEDLIESELFGHEKGAFTGADKTRAGLIESAEGGTLFLDEIGDMPLLLQTKLLRFLQERTIERVGGQKSIDVDVRVVCATNKNLEHMVTEKTFREDLFYRITELVIDIPPLRARNGDKALLARHFLRKYAAERDAAITGFSDNAINAIEHYEWPGNVREMENKVKKAVILAESTIVQAEDLGLHAAADTMNLSSLRDFRRTAERQAILQALSISGNNVSAAARHLGVTRPVLYDMIKKYSLTVNN